ncbi:MAG: hypothetical protein QOH59_1189 [Gemmatimonadales bacterium]|nr:hypothetical protein [Gemmatimonadales bacterium]
MSYSSSSTPKALRIVVCDEQCRTPVAATTLRSAGYEVLETFDCLSAYELSLTVPDGWILVTDLLEDRPCAATFYYLQRRMPALSLLCLGHSPALAPGPAKSKPRMAQLDKPFTPGELLAAVARLLPATVTLAAG